MRHTTFLISLILAILISCSSDETIREPDLLFLLKPGKTAGRLGFSGSMHNNGDIVPLQHGMVDFNNSRITILDPVNRKIMVLKKDGTLEQESTLPEKIQKRLNTTLTVDPEGRIFFLSARNTDKGRVFSLWKLYKRKFKKLFDLKTRISSSASSGIKTSITSIPAGLVPLNDEKLAIVWKSRILKTKKNRMTGQDEYLFSTYTVSSLQILTHEDSGIRTLDLQPSFFTNSAGKDYTFRRLDYVQALSGGDKILIKAGYTSRKNSRIIKKMLFSVMLKNGKAHEIPVPGKKWDGILGVTDDDRIFTLDRVYNKNQKTRASISIWKTDGNRIFTFRIESNPVSSILGGLFLSRDGTLFSFQRLRSNIYSRSRGIRFLSWK